MWISWRFVWLKAPKQESVRESSGRYGEIWSASSNDTLKTPAQFLIGYGDDNQQTPVHLPLCVTSRNRSLHDSHMLPSIMSQAPLASIERELVPKDEYLCQVILVMEQYTESREHVPTAFNNTTWGDWNNSSLHEIHCSSSRVAMWSHAAVFIWRSLQTRYI